MQGPAKLTLEIEDTNTTKSPVKKKVMYLQSKQVSENQAALPNDFNDKLTITSTNHYMSVRQQILTSERLNRK